MSSRASPDARAHTATTIATTSSAENRQASSRHSCRPTHLLQVEDPRYSRGTYRSPPPPPARSDVSRSQQGLESSKRPSSFVHEQPRVKSARPENGSVYPRTVRKDSHSPSSTTTTRASHSPLQPRRILLSGGGGGTDDERPAFGSRSAAAAVVSGPEEDGRRGGSSITVTGATATATATSELDEQLLLLHRPNPIAPPNHECSWKDRYLALTAEIRLLKAELSTRASLRGPDVGYMGHVGDGGVRGETEDGDDDDLGIEGVTIVVHLKGRDDLVINTDLTQAAE
ncbi:hypothetical protein F4811DRAFT_570469 [Daldinia bambusicola]|nr:hypothetical protein F4811DRAFT_570469 [Daldinia bambusicola]